MASTSTSFAAAMEKYKRDPVLMAGILLVLGVVLLAIGSGFGTLIVTSFGIVFIVVAVVAAVGEWYDRSGKTIIEEKLNLTK